MYVCLGEQIITGATHFAIKFPLCLNMNIFPVACICTCITNRQVAFAVDRNRHE